MRHFSKARPKERLPLVLLVLLTAIWLVLMQLLQNPSRRSGSA
jgi:hypothetical protein